MSVRKKAYELSESQVTTPLDVVSFFWKVTANRRDCLGSVLDMGAGDCRFARGDQFNRYVGVEIDPRRSRYAKLPHNGELVHDCAFRHTGLNYDACIGNPPYVRHHDIENPWKQRTAQRLETELGLSLDRHCNLYLYFLCLGILKSREDGLVSLIIPFEWVSRPSAKAIRDYISRQGWEVNVYRFQKPIFDGVLTTASVSIVDKRPRNGQWRFFDITPDLGVVPQSGAVKAMSGVLDYAERGKIWAMRGLSPGSQEVFTLTEGERIHSGLSKCDVVPCVTTLKNFPRSKTTLSAAAFRKHFVDAGERCWLIKSYATKRSIALDAYLAAVPDHQRDTYTCNHQTPWFNYLPHPVPEILVASGFTKFGPKVLVNSVGARAVGSVLGVHSKKPIPLRRLQRHLTQVDFETQVVAHAKTLKKIEVKQLNAVLNSFVAGQGRYGKDPR
jgi:hypothetical protein